MLVAPNGHLPVHSVTIVLGCRSSNPVTAEGGVTSVMVGGSESSSSNQMTGSMSSSPPGSLLASVVTIAPSTGDSTDGAAQGSRTISLHKATNFQAAL